MRIAEKLRERNEERRELRAQRRREAQALSDEQVLRQAGCPPGARLWRLNAMSRAWSVRRDGTLLVPEWMATLGKGDLIYVTGAVSWMMPNAVIGVYRVTSILHLDGTPPGWQHVRISGHLTAQPSSGLGQWTQ